MSALIVGAQPIRVITAGSVLVIILLISGRRYLPDLWNMVWRLKWFWLSILVFYGWLIPGNAAFDTAYLPSQDGIALGLIRIAVLLDIIIAVILLVRTTPREQLIPAITWLLRPLGLFGIQTHVFSYRLVLTLEIAADFDAIIKERIKALEPGTSMLQGGIDIVAGQLVAIENVPASKTQTPIELPALALPQWWQWLYPVLLLLILTMIK